MRLDGAISKINIFLSLATVVLAVYFAFVMAEPYLPVPLNGKSLKLRQSDFSVRESIAMLQGAYAFDEGIFKRKQLFVQPQAKKAAPEKIVFKLLGVSMGNKNLAVIRDGATNKDYYCAEGDRIGNFKVKQILKDSVTLESPDRTIEISQ